MILFLVMVIIATPCILNMTRTVIEGMRDSIRQRIKKRESLVLKVQEAHLNHNLIMQE